MTEFNKICGGTPLIKINNNLYAKLEAYNPTGSVKDRMISYVVDKALNNKEINNNSVLVEATSGNSGISLAAIAASMGLKCIIFMPCNMSEERKQMMRLYGATIIESAPSDFLGAIAMRDDYLKNNLNAWSPKQFSNLDNIECHRDKTAPEIKYKLWMLNQKWHAFIHGSGTGGTIEGIRQFVKSNMPSNEPVKVCMVVPDESNHGIQGIGDGKDFLANPDDMDLVIRVSTDEAIARSKLFAKQTGLLVGISSGANLVASEKYLENNQVDGVVVTMLCDRGERYMSIY